MQCRVTQSPCCTADRAIPAATGCLAISLLLSEDSFWCKLLSEGSDIKPIKFVKIVMAVVKPKPVLKSFRLQGSLLLGNSYQLSSFISHLQLMQLDCVWGGGG